MSQRPLVLAITGASGAIYAVRLLQMLLGSGREIHLTISPAAATVIQQELGITLQLDGKNADVTALVSGQVPTNNAEVRARKST